MKKQIRRRGLCGLLAVAMLWGAAPNSRGSRDGRKRLGDL